MAKNIPTDLPTAAQVRAFLAANPEFLSAAHAGANTASDKIIDIAPAIAKRAQQEARHMRDANQSMRHVVAANMVSWQKLHHATLALLASTDVPSLGEVIAQDFPPIFDLASAVLISTNAASIGPGSGFLTVAADQMDAATAGKKLVLGAPNEHALAMLDSPAPSVAMVRLPDQLDAPVSHCLLLLSGKQADSFSPDLGSELLTLLAEMVGVALAARLEGRAMAHGDGGS